MFSYWLVNIFCHVRLMCLSNTCFFSFKRISSYVASELLLLWWILCMNVIKICISNKWRVKWLLVSLAVFTYLYLSQSFVFFPLISLTSPCCHVISSSSWLKVQTRIRCHSTDWRFNFTLYTTWLYLKYEVIFITWTSFVVLWWWYLSSKPFRKWFPQIILSIRNTCVCLCYH